MAKVTKDTMIGELLQIDAHHPRWRLLLRQLWFMESTRMIW